MKNNPKIKYGAKNLLPEKLDLRNATVMISMKIEGDLLEAIKNKAKELNKPYQTMMKEILREHLELSKSEMDDHIRKIVRQEMKKAAG